MRDQTTAVLLTTRETATAEADAIANGTPGSVLMERAGAAVTRACESFAGRGRRATVLCGPGNNGGDGFVVARLLSEAGWDVIVLALDPADRWAGDAGLAKARWAGAILHATQFATIGAHLIVDALFGAGLSRPLAGAAQTLVAEVNACGRPVIAVDIPSGVDGTSGAVRGAAIDADLTVTFGTGKPGHYLYPGRRHRGRLEVADIGLPSRPAAVPTWLNGPSVWQADYPWPGLDGHKYKRGHAVVVSGASSHTGAARLAARGALRIGAGLVTLASPRDALAVNAAHLTAVMLREADGPDGLATVLGDARKNTVIFGPGLGVGPDTRALVERALAPQAGGKPDDPPRARLLDADALTSFAGDATCLATMIGRAAGPVVITPHDGEFARLFAGHDSVLTGSKLDRTRAAAALLGCVVLLKGPDTVVAAPDGRATIDDGGSPWLATAGSGDVLSGMIGGLMAQGMPAFSAAAAGSYLHAAAARLFGPGLIAEDIPEKVPAALRNLRVEWGLSEA